MKIIDGKIRLGEKIVIEMDDGKTITRKIQAQGCPSFSAYFVNIDGKRVKVNGIERAEASLNETEQKMVDELQRAYDRASEAIANNTTSSDAFNNYYFNSEIFARIVIGHDIKVRDGRVVALVG